jgi:xanthine dehydrogenase YagR molybdenum-binding subunit
MASIVPAAIGTPTLRIDGRAKVTGAARYGSDEAVANAAHAYLITSAIARGRVIGFELEAARRVPGLIDILTHDTVRGQVKTPSAPGGKGKTTTTLESDQVWHAGQIVAVVVAETYEAAREAANKVTVRYAEEAPAATFDSPGVRSEPAATANQQHQDPEVGNAEQALAAAEVKIEAEYETPTQHHNPMELFTTTCLWSGDRLTIYEPSQFVHAVRAEVAKQLGLELENVRVISRFVGGGFGSRGGITSRTAWIALAARRINRPVKLVATRAQGFTIATYRAETRHRVRLGATRDGRLQSLSHEGWEVTSRPSTYNVAGTATTARLYNCSNVWTRVNIVHADRNTPGFMRAPPETPYLFALESAMDELAVALAIDPVELRRMNDTAVEPIKGLPYTSRNLIACFDEAAAAFGWQDRSPAPASMRNGDWLIGWGCAAATYHASISAAAARVRLTPEGTARVETAAHDIGTGALTVIAMTAADRLGLSVDKVAVEIGDSDLPPGGLAAGSTHTASVCTVVAKACDDIKERIARAATRANDSPFAGAEPASLMLAQASLRLPNGASEPLDKAVGRLGGAVEVYAENIPPGAPPKAAQMVYHGQPAMARGSELKDQIRYSFGAQFVEVNVHALTREIRVSRATGAFAAGTIINPVTARSQLMGGMIWGISAALFEATEIDRERARYGNDDFAEYLVPVNADIGKVEVIFVPEEDRDVNPLGIKGIGELGTTGMNAAVANAVYHGTGIRVRKLPLRLDALFA